MPDDAIAVPFEVSGQDVLQRALEASAKSSDRAAAALDKQGKSVKFVTAPYQRLIELNKQMAQATGLQNRPAMLGSNRAIVRTQEQITNKPNKPEKPKAFTTGPRQQLAKMQEEQARAEREGNTDAAKDIAHRVAQTQGQIARQDKPRPENTDFGKRFTAFLRSTRFNAGGGLSPLIGKTADLFGAGEELVGRFGLIGTAAKLAAEGLDSAAAAGNRMGALNIANGSSSGVSAALSNLNMGDDSARAFNAAITSDPMAMGYAAQLGIQNAPGPFGNQDWGGLELDAMKKVKHMNGTDEDRLRAARALHIDGPWMNLSDNTFDQMAGSDANRQGAAFNKDFVTKSAELSASSDHLKQSFDNLTTRLSGTAMNIVTAVNNEMADIFSGSMTWHRFLTGDGEDSTGRLKTTPGTEHIEKNTKATEDLTKAIGMSQRQYGHGERTDAALPKASGMGSGWALRQNLQAGAMRLGAFGG